MGRWQGSTERSTIGRCFGHQFTGGETKEWQLVSDPSGTGPRFFYVHSETPFHLRQGDSTVEATALDPIIYGRVHYLVIVTSENDNYISVKHTASQPDVIQVYEAGNARPGDGASEETGGIEL